jgi:hypothetical protein
MPKMVIEVPEEFTEVGEAMADHLAALQRTVSCLGGGKAVDYAGIEQAMAESAGCTELAGHRAILQRLDLDVPAVMIGGVRYTRVGRCEAPYHTIRFQKLRPSTGSARGRRRRPVGYGGSGRGARWRGSARRKWLDLPAARVRRRPTGGRLQLRKMSSTFTRAPLPNRGSGISWPARQVWVCPSGVDTFTWRRSGSITQNSREPFSRQSFSLS